MLFEIGLLRFQKLHAHIGRIADHDIEAAARENIREGRVPVERPIRERWIVDEAVAAVDRRFKVLQPMLAPRRLQPQRKPRDLDRLRVEIDAEEIFGDDLVENVEVDFGAELAQGAHRVAIAPRHLVEGCDEKRAGAAGWIEDGEIAQRREIGLPEGDLARRLRLVHAMRGPKRGAAFVERKRNRALDEKARHHVGRIDDPRALAFRDGGRRLALAVRLQLLDVGDRLLENMAEDGDRHFAPIIPLAELRDVLRQRIRQHERVGNFVLRKEAAVIRPDRQPFVAAIDGAEKRAENSSRSAAARTCFDPLRHPPAICPAKDRSAARRR